jgi:hypothetical protein
MASIVSNDFLDRLIESSKQEQKIVLSKYQSTDPALDSKYIQLLSQLIACALKIKKFKEPPKEDNKAKKK